MGRLTVLTTSPRLPAGLATRRAWQRLTAAAVFAPSGHPWLPVLDAEEVAARPVDPDDPATADQLLTSAVTGDVVWLTGPDGDDPVVQRIRTRLAAGDPPGVEWEFVAAAWDPPGARLLDAVAVMDRLRSPGGCPWDADQTRESLAPYLIEEAYEVVDAIERGDDDELRAELGDLLLQVLFHARIAEEGQPRWSIDDVAAGLVDKLVRRHPHVFAADGPVVRSAEDTLATWEQIKAAERADRPDYAGIPFGQPALRLAAAVQRRMAGLGRTRPVEPAAPRGVGEVVDADGAAALLWEVVARCQEVGVDAESALRALVRRVTDVPDHLSTHQ